MDRKRLIKNMVLALAAIWCMGQALPVYASGNPSVALKNAGTDMKKRTLQVDCNLENTEQVTNGKLRVTYDGSKLRLLDNQAGNVISDTEALCETNDCLTGNKKEGEIVFAFASAEAMLSEGCLANMTFSITDKVAKGEKVTVSVAVENMAGDEGKIAAQSKNLTVTIKDDAQDNSGDNGNNNPGDDGNNGDNNPGGNGNNGANQGGISGRPGITGGQAGSDDADGSSTRGSLTGSRSSVGRGVGNSSRNSIKSRDGETDQDSGESENSSRSSGKKDGKEETSSADETRLQNSEDEKVPMAGMNTETAYWWIIPIAVLAAVLAVIAYKKKNKKDSADNQTV